MTTLRAFIKRHSVLTYYILTFTITWGGLLGVGGLDGLTGATWQSDPRLPFLTVAMLAGPSVSGLLLTGLVAGRAGYRELLARLLTWRVGLGWYTVALLAAPLVFMVVQLALSLTSPVFLPSMTTSGTAALLAALVGALAVGIFEELGWTGFAIPQLRRRHGVLATGLIAGVLWGAWHLLTNDVWIGTTYSGDLPVVLFLTVNGLTLLFGQLPAFRVLMVWVYDRTGSLLVAMLMHASLSACTFIIGPAVRGVDLVIYGVALAAAWWVVVGAVALATGGHLTRRQPLRPQAV